MFLLLLLNQSKHSKSIKYLVERSIKRKYRPYASGHLDKVENHQLQNMIEDLISKMGILFTSPEEMVVQQDDKANQMYFIVAGSCVITQINSNKKHEWRPKHLLTSGDHFGEVGCLYKCNRTCNIKTIDNCILGLLTR